MSILKNPLLSLDARGGLAKLFTLVKRGGRHIIETKPHPIDRKSAAQLFNRNMFSMCADLWHTLSEAERTTWESLARPLHMTGYAWYISQCLRPNPGIYLPLLGGTMTGDIVMNTNRLLQLPDPLLAQEAATKAYADTHGMTLHEATHTAGGVDEIDSALAIEAMANLATGKMWQGNGSNRPSEVDPPSGFWELVGDSSPSGASDVEFTGLSGDLFLLFYSVYPSADTELVLRLNGVTSADYDMRQFLNGTTLSVSTSVSRFILCHIDNSHPAAGCVIITGKRVPAQNRLTIGHFGAPEFAHARLLINGLLNISAGDLSSVKLWPLGETFTGKVKMYKVA